MTLDIESIIIPEPAELPDVIVVAWIDAESQSGYARVDEKRQTGMVNYDVGYLAAETDDWVILAQERYDTMPNDIAGYRRTIGIPKVLIKTVVRLTPVTEPDDAASIL